MNHVLKSSVAALALCGLAPAAMADDVKIGILLGFTGPIESLTPQMGASAELAIAEASDSGLFLGGQTISGVRGDSTCIDSSAATASAERLVSSDNIVGLMGADCSGVTMAVLNNVATPNDLVMISPSATSPALSADTDKQTLGKTNTNLSTVTAEKDNMTFLGISLTKGNYKMMMWGIVGALLLFLLFFIYKFKNSNAITTQARKALDETEKEFEEHRTRALEREQKVMRKLQDEINKHKKATAK